MTDRPPSKDPCDDESGDELAARRGLDARARDLVASVNPRSHEFGGDVRLRARSGELGQSSEERMDGATTRDADACARDLTALARDHASRARSRVMNDRDASYEHEGARRITGAEVVMRAGEQRRRAARERTLSGEYRAMADEDHRAAALDRELAARDRMLALADREAFVRQLARTETDPLTGARTRLAGLVDLDHEIDRCRRTSGLLIVAYVDVIGLKFVNDDQGHGAGELLMRVVATIAKRLRSYDLIVRLGGDEFLCAMSNMTLTDASQRLAESNAALAAAPHPAAIRWGLARLLAADDTAIQLIARADQQLIDIRR